MTTVYKYRIYCSTDSKYEFAWAETEPATCPTNTAHTIDASKTTIVETNKADLIEIKEETTPTGRHYQISMGKITAAAVSSTTTVNWSRPFPISALSILFNAAPANIGDGLEVHVGPDTIIGTIAVNVAVDDLIIEVSQTVMDNIALGYWVKIDDGVNNQDLGRVTNVDTVNSRITIENKVTDAYVVATPTYIKMTVKIIWDFEIFCDGYHKIGDSKIGGSYIPANTNISILYTNNDGVSTKDFIAYVEYLY